MPLTPGSRLGPYEITAQIGAGGMGEVYRARDTQLGREVAIKVVPEAFASDPERLARFEREARTLAALNHSNIAQIHGLEKSNGQTALVMELVEGPTLADRIAQGPIPVDEALPIAKQITDALEAAHEQGIIHRDLKPANIKVRADGTVKVLDFGLAKALDPAAAARSTAALTNSPTITSPAAMTGVGVLLGTAGYMSPEQAKGRPADRRSDVWALGAVLFEMLTGQRAFEGDDFSDTLAAVLRGDPDWEALPAGLSPTLVVFLTRCLQKDPKQRLGDIHDMRLALEGAFDTSAPPAALSTLAPVPRGRAWATAVTSGLVGALMAAATLWTWTGSHPAPDAPTRLSVNLPADRPLDLFGYPTRALAISPDGTQLVYQGIDPDVPADRAGGQTRLTLRSLPTLAVRDLPGTIDPRQPFFSPDGRWVAFFTSTGELKKVPLTGGNPITLMENINGSRWAFGVWMEDDTIVFGTNVTGLRRVSAEGGGEVTVLTTLDPAQGEVFHRFLAPVPSGRAVLFTNGYHEYRDMRIEAVRLDSGARQVVVEDAHAPLVLSSGHLLFQRRDAILMAPFDTESLKLTGPAVPFIDAVQMDDPFSPYPVAQLAVSQTGTLAFVPAADRAGSLGTVGRDGTFTPMGVSPGNFRLPRVAPDGHAVAFIEAQGRESVVRVYDLERGSNTRLGQEGFDVAATWYPDSRSLAVSSQTVDASGIFSRHLDGTEDLIEPLPPDVFIFRGMSWSPDRSELAYTAQYGGQHDIWILTPGETSARRPFLDSPASEFNPAFSPDGDWLAYASDESGRFEVYIRRYPRGERLTVSTDGGNSPVWGTNGRELFFQGREGGVEKLMAVSVTPGGESLELGNPVGLFDLRVPGPTGETERYAASGNMGAGYDVLPDGRFVMVREPDPTSTREIVVVQNWAEEVKARVAK